MGLLDKATSMGYGLLNRAAANPKTTATAIGAIAGGTTGGVVGEDGKKVQSTLLGAAVGAGVGFGAGHLFNKMNPIAAQKQLVGAAPQKLLKNGFIPTTPPPSNNMYANHVRFN